MTYQSSIESIVAQNICPSLFDTLRRISEEAYQELALEKLCSLTYNKQADILCGIYHNYIKSRLHEPDLDIHDLPSEFQKEVDIYRSIMHFFKLDIEEDIEEYIKYQYEEADSIKDRRLMQEVFGGDLS